MAAVPCLQAAEGKIDPPGAIITYGLPPPQARVVARFSSASVSSSTVEVIRGVPQFPVPPFDYTVGYSTVVVSTPLGTTTARYSPGANPDDFYHPDWEITETGIFESDEYSALWYVTTAVGPNMELFMANATNVTPTTATQGDTTWTFSNPLPHLTETIATENSTPWSGWGETAPAASFFSDGAGNGSRQKCEYKIVAPPALIGKRLRWQEIFTPADGSASQSTAKAWVINGSQSQVYSLSPSSAGSSVVTDLEVDEYYAELAVDANRDGEIKLPGEENADVTSAAQPYRFWLNDDDDVDDDDPEDSEKAPIDTADYTDDKIDGIRDLEDFSRLKIYLGGLQDMVTQGTIRVGLKWKPTPESTGSPSLKVWRNYSLNGGTEYLAEAAVAQQHLTLRAPGLLEGTTPYIIPTQYWTDVGLSAAQPYGNLLFEGCTAGKGQLVITLHNSDGIEISESAGVWIDLKNVKSMYERVKATADGAENFPFPYNHVGSDPVPAPTMGWTPDPNGYAFEPASDERSTYIVFVHGWNQIYERSTMYAETMFKRVWHRGYKGRFVRFRWPTFTGLPSYNDSEYRAWKCGVSLKQYLDTLPSTYTINLVAHSMGNIVAGSALEQGASVANYVLLNAAVPAICYDTSGNVVQTSWGYVTPNDDPDPTTVTLSYQGRLSNASGNLVNFFLPADSALSAWELNNDSPSGGRFLLVGAKPHAFPDGALENAGYRYQRSAATGQKLRVVRVAGERILNSSDEAMGFAVQAPSLTVGADGRTRGSIDDWVDMTAYGFDSVHSAEFLFTIHQTREFYGTLLPKLGVAVQP